MFCSYVKELPQPNRGAYVVRSLPSKVSLSMLTPSGGSLTMVISSFCSLRCNQDETVEVFFQLRLF